MERIDKHNYYLDVAETIIKRATCIRRNRGAVIVKNDEIVSTGYSGAPRGRANCSELGYCARNIMNFKSGEHYELCRSVHAEQNAVISAGRKNTLGATLYLVGKEYESGKLLDNDDCCIMCKRVIINAGIEKVVIRINKTDYKVVNVQDWIDYDEVLEEYVKPLIKKEGANSVN